MARSLRSLDPEKDAEDTCSWKVDPQAAAVEFISRRQP